MKKWLKKSGAVILTAAMLVSVFQGTKGTPNTVYAEENSEPTSAYWIDKTQLETNYNLNGKSTAKIKFGADAREWYIAGRDKMGTNNQTDDDTLVMLSASAFDTTAFGSDSRYSTSNFVKDIQKYSDQDETTSSTYLGSRYFSDAELDKMVEVTVKTVEYDQTGSREENGTPVTSKLYLPDAANMNAYGRTSIYVGTNSDVEIKLTGLKVAATKDNFWLRSPDVKNSHSTLVAYVDEDWNAIGLDNPDSGSSSIVPALNLDPSSVLFASAADAASAAWNGDKKNSDMTANTYTLRYAPADNSWDNTEAVISYDGTKVTAKNASGKYLMVQNEKGVNATRITSDKEVVKAAGITIDNEAVTNFDGCKVWLESTDANDRITTAKTAAKAGIVTITSVALTDIEAPAAGQTLDRTAVCETEGIDTEEPVVSWTPADEKAGYNTDYTASITLNLESGFLFGDTVTATVNGKTATSVTENADGGITVTYAFPKTEKDKLLSITAPQPVTAANGTAYDDMNLPTQVNVVTEGKTLTTADVTWDTATPASGSYDPAVLDEQNITLNGTVTCPDTIDANNVKLTTTIAVKISAAGTVGAPVCNPVAGTYTDDQTVTLQSSTEGAAIYYTTDGTEPDTANGIKYTSPISVTGTKDKVVTTTIKAIAVKGGMKNSEIQTFTYTIDMTHVHDFSYTYKWSDDNTECTATRRCAICAYTDSETETATASVTQKKTCILPELTKYVVEFKNDANNGFESQTRENVQTAGASGHSIGDWIIDKPASEKETGSRHKECTVCGTILQKEEIKRMEAFEYKIVEGANSTWTRNTDGSIVIRGNGEISKFKEVRVDGKVIDSGNYTVTEGSTVITLKADYLQTLSAGSHSFEIVWTDGSASTNFAVVKTTSEDSKTDNKGSSNKSAQTSSKSNNSTDTKNTKNTEKNAQNTTAPETGDSSDPALWIMLLAASLAGMTGILIKGKGKHCQ